MEEILEILEESATEENFNLLSAGNTVKFPVREIFGNDTGQVLLTVERRFDLDYPNFSGTTCWKSVDYDFHARKLENGIIHVFLHNITRNEIIKR